MVVSADENDVQEVEELTDIPIRKAVFGKPPNIGDTIHVMAGLNHTPAEVTAWGDSISYPGGRE